VANGHRVEAVLSRTAASARALADRVGAPVASASGEALPPSVRLVWICVPDDAIGTVAEALAEVDHPWPDTTVAHTSGAKSAAVLSPLEQAGAAPLSFHPMQTFAEDTPPEAFSGIVVGLQGGPAAVEKGGTVARTLGAQPVRLSAHDKARYHAAAALASNGLVALMAAVKELLPLPQEAPSAPVDHAGVAPLVARTWENLQGGAPEEALTGPVARGDEETVRAHLQALRDETPHLLPLYAALSTEMVRVAVRGEHLSPSQAKRLRARLRTAVDIPNADETGGESGPAPSGA
jgi:predicted short-subunit dehydrogenase-like oxidoreductase (DUF2520 family)